MRSCFTWMCLASRRQGHHQISTRNHMGILVTMDLHLVNKLKYLIFPMIIADGPICKMQQTIGSQRKQNTSCSAVIVNIWQNLKKWSISTPKIMISTYKRHWNINNICFFKLMNYKLPLLISYLTFGVKKITEISEFLLWEHCIITK